MKLSQLKPGLKISIGEVEYISGVERDPERPDQWDKDRKGHYSGWIVTVRADGVLVDVKFDYNDDYDLCKYSFEGNDKWRKKLK